MKCQQCKKTIEGNPVYDEVGFSSIPFCSWGCIYEFRADEKLPKNRGNGICANCGKPIEKGLVIRVCSTKCAGELVAK